MTIERIIELLEIEHECMLRKAHNKCDSKCNECDLVQDDGELHDMYTNVITLLKDYGHVLHLARAMHTWIFLHTMDEFEVYDELGFTDEDNALLGSIGGQMVIANNEKVDINDRNGDAE